ncbi:MAG TPA: hypothetical protein VF149_07430 [Bacillales bacterium]
MSPAGRPKSENPRAFTVPEVRVTREEQRMFDLKAALYAGNSTAKLIRSAVKKYHQQLPDESCSECGKKMSVMKQSESYEITVADQKYHIKVMNIPIHTCSSCKLVNENVYLMAALEEVVENEVFHYLKHRQPIPPEISFQNLLETEIEVV